MERRTENLRHIADHRISFYPSSKIPLSEFWEFFRPGVHFENETLTAGKIELAIEAFDLLLRTLPLLLTPNERDLRILSNAYLRFATTLLTILADAKEDKKADLN